MAALAVALAGNRLLWGYWATRPTLAAELEGADGLLGISFIEADLDTGAVTVKPRAPAAEVVESHCRPYTNECLEGQLLQKVQERTDTTLATPEVEREVVTSVWARVAQEGWRPTPAGPAYARTAKPAAGLAVYFEKGEDRYVLLGQRTSEISNDRYGYSESLLRMNGTNAQLARQVHFFYEIAGIEGLQWPILWPIAFAALLIGYGLVVYFRGRRTTTNLPAAHA